MATQSLGPLPLRIRAPLQRMVLHGIQETRSLEAQPLLDGPPPSLLMRRAGAAVGRLALALAPHARCFWIAAGSGKNGGDGLLAALWLAAAGKRVAISLPRPPPVQQADAHAAWQQALAAGLPISEDARRPADLASEDLAIDAVLGLGARADDGPPSPLLEQFQSLPCPILAVDLPSGLNADTGQAFGHWAVQARHTLSLLSLKPGLFTGAGRDLAGAIWFDDLGQSREQVTARAWLAGRPERTALQRRHAQHKGSFGDVAVVGGAAGMVGGALLAARAAHAAGAGRVFVDLIRTGATGVDLLHPELMFRPGWSQSQNDGALQKATVLAGCGGGELIRVVLPHLLTAAPRLVLDADALNAIATQARLADALQARAQRGFQTVLTPHPLEAARLMACDIDELQADRLRSAEALAQRFQCSVVLKGSGSVVASPGETTSLNPTGNAALASAGTGDVLAGWLAGQWSQRGGAAHTATVDAVWWHGQAADEQPARQVLRASELIERLHAAQQRA